MNKIFSTLIFTITITLLFAQGKRYVLVEHFSNTESADCATLNPDFYDVLDNNLPDIHQITYHTNDPANCIFHNANPTDNLGQAGIYGISNDAPRAVLNGTVVPANATELMNQSQLNFFLGATSPLIFTQINFDEVMPGSGVYNVNGIIKTEGSRPQGNFTLRSAIVERNVVYTAPNGETEHRNIMRIMLPDWEGESFIPAPPGNAKFFGTYTTTIDPTWNVDSLYVLCWIQDDFNEVFNSGSNLDPQPLEASIDPNSLMNVSCFGESDGAIFVDVEGGTPPYDYLWFPTGDVTEDLTNIPANIYTLTITDAIGNTANVGANISEPPPITISTTSVNDLDNNCIGEACAFVSGGLFPYTINWYDNTTGNLITSGQDCIQNICAGEYLFEIIDANYCTESVVIQVQGDFGPLDCSGIIDEPSCFGANDGSIIIECFDFSPPLVCNWTGPGTFTAQTCDIFNLSAGVYELVVTDAFGSVNNQLFEILEPTPVDVNVETTDDFDELCNGAAEANVTGGTGVYTITWLPGGSTGLSIDNLCAGDYEVQVTDDNNCGGIFDFSVFANSTFLNVSVSDSSDISCFGEEDGTIEINITGGTPPYLVGWAFIDPVTGIPVPIATNPPNATMQNNLEANIYQITVNDAALAQETISITIEEPTQLTLSTNSNDACTDANGNSLLGESCAVVSGGTLPYQYQWNNGSADSCAVNLAAGIYTVTIFDANFCQVQQNNILISQADSCITSTNDFDFEYEMNIFPKQFNNQFNISYEGKSIESAEIQLLTTSGKVVFSEDLGNIHSGFEKQIVLNKDLANGVYLVAIKFKGGIFEDKLIKF